MGKLYFAKYDVHVDDYTGKILDMCTCPPYLDCQYKTAWTMDGAPIKLTNEQLEELKTDESSTNYIKQH